MKEINKAPQIGELYLVDFDGCGSEQKGKRPGLVFQNNTGNKYSPNIIVLPLTSSLKKSGQPTHVVIPANEQTGLRKDSMVLCENPICVSKERLGSYLTTLPQDYMAQISVAYLLATSAISFIDPCLLTALWQKSVLLNS